MERLWILVVEDDPDNIRAAQVALADHELIVVTSYDDASLLIKPGGSYARGRVLMDVPRFEEICQHEGCWFDVVLLDCILPRCREDERAICLPYTGKQLNVFKKLYAPYGPILALLAIKQGVKRIGMLSSGGDHHEDPLVYTLEHFTGTYDEDPMAFDAGDVRMVVKSNLTKLVEAESFGPVVAVESASGLSFDQRYLIQSSGEQVELSEIWKERGKIRAVKDWGAILQELIKE